VLAALSRHRLGRLRQLALRTLATRFPEQEPELLENSLFDQHPGVRQLAQHYTRARGVDPADRYRSRVPELPRLSLLGLGEVGRKEDASLAVPHATSVEAGVRRAATRAVGRLDPEGHLELLLRSLGDPSAGVSREALRGLTRLASRIADPVWGLCEATRHAHVRLNSFRLLKELGNWDRLRYGLRAVAHSEADLRDHGARLVELSLAEWNRSFVDPSDEQMDEILKAIDRSAGRLDKTLRSDLLFALKPYR
jgi:hypothetical protein